MRFRSTQAKEVKPETVSFIEALLSCLPDDGGLYVPASSVDFRQFGLYMEPTTTYQELLAAAGPTLLNGELNPEAASRLAESINFSPELRQLDENLSLLFLNHGPTGWYKDFGFSFVAAALEQALALRKTTAMVVTASSDVAGAGAARAFAGKKGISSVILYPRGKLHGLDPKTFMPNGGSIIPIQVEGNFDDCQRLVKEIIYDRDFSGRYHVSSANSINVGRIMPQALYYLYAFTLLKEKLLGDLIFSVPCGSFGNLISGLYAWKFGMPVNGFIAAMNENNALGDILRCEEPEAGKFVKKTVKQTVSRSLDVGDPSNRERLLSFYEEAPSVMRNMVVPESIDDATTISTIRTVWNKYGVMLSPAGAVAFAAAQRQAGSFDEGAHIVVLCTGHPARYPELFKEATGISPIVPDRLKTLQEGFDPIAHIDADLEALEGAIASCY
jgi:threonine synthase